MMRKRKDTAAEEAEANAFGETQIEEVVEEAPEKVKPAHCPFCGYVLPEGK